MFDINSFKKSVRAWMNNNPEGTVNDLLDYCEDMIPPGVYASHKWLVDQTVAWYRHVQAHRETDKMMANGFDDVA
ncbi:hypothetical protein N9W79_00160 [bacterium]|nr:hypothetical protein [bacterium]